MSDENDNTDSTPSRKLSAKAVWGKIKRADIPEKGVKPLFTIIGQAMGVRKGTSEYGEWTALVGTFEATNIDTGEVFSGPECFLPEPFNSMIANKLQGVGAVHAIDFAFEIGIKAAPADQPTRVPYEYTCKPIQDPTAGDPLKALRGRVSEHRKALPAPAKKAK
jgi:hypothetical protein